MKQSGAISTRTREGYRRGGLGTVATGCHDVAVIREDLARSQQTQWDLIRDEMAAYAAHRPVRSVAVVGNAPLEPDPARAAAVDACDLVIRANEVGLDEPGGPPCAGRACHVVLLSRATPISRWALQDYRRRAYFVPQAGFVQYHLEDKVGLLLETAFWPDDLGIVPLPNAVVKARTVAALDPEHTPGSIIPTTGTTAVFMAHEMFPGADLVLTGFSFLDQPDQTHWSHHAGTATKVNWQHRLDLEARLLRSWIDDGTARYLP